MAFEGKNPNKESIIFNDKGVAAVGNAPTGKVRIINRDGTLFSQSDTGTEALLGGSGSGEINYISNPNAEIDTAGYADYDDGPVAVPINGTDGTAANLTFTRQDTFVIRDLFTFQIAKAGADAQGEGISYDFTIDNADRNKLLKLALDYNTDGTYTDGDIALFIYDVTNDVLITPSDNEIVGVDKDGNSTGQRTIGWSSTDSTSYRLIFHITEATSNSYDFYFDNVIVGPGSVAITNETPKTVWMDENEVSISSDQGGALQYFNIQYTKDSNGVYFADLDFLISGSSNVTAHVITIGLGSGITFSNNTPGVQGIATNGKVRVSPGTATFTVTFGGVTSASEGSLRARLSGKPDAFDANRDQSTVNLLSSNVAAANVSSKWVITDTAYTNDTVMDFDTERSNYTNVGNWANTNGVITIPEDGKYTFSGSVYFNNTAPVNSFFSIYKNGSLEEHISRTTGDPTYRPFQATISSELELSKGDTVSIRANGSMTLTAGEDHTYLSIVRQQQYSAGQPVGFGIATADTYGLVKKPNGTVELDTANGHGSSGTSIRRWTNSTTTGTSFTYADSSTNGMSVTANRDMIMSVTWTDRDTGSSVKLGISVNASSLSNDIQTIARSERPVSEEGPTNVITSTTATFKVSSGDVIRTHGDGTANFTGSAGTALFQEVFPL